jgi:hypothetical protein
MSQQKSHPLEVALFDWIEKFYPGIVLFSQGAATSLSSPLLRFTTEFEMDRCGSTAL